MPHKHHKQAPGTFRCHLDHVHTSNEEREDCNRTTRQKEHDRAARDVAKAKVGQHEAEKAHAFRDCMLIQHVGGQAAQGGHNPIEFGVKAGSNPRKAIEPAPHRKHKK